MPPPNNWFYHQTRQYEQFKKFKYEDVRRNQYNKSYGFFFVTYFNRELVRHYADGNLNAVGVVAQLKMERPLTIIDDGKKFILIDRSFYDKIKDKHDSVIVRHMNGNGVDEFVVFEPEQITIIGYEVYAGAYSQNGTYKFVPDLPMRSNP